MPKKPETLFKEFKSDIVLKHGIDSYYGATIVIYRQHNGQWRYFVVYNGRILYTNRGESQAQSHKSALAYLQARGYK